MRTYFIAALLASGALATAAEREVVRHIGDGGLLAVDAGQTRVVSDTDTLIFDEGGIYYEYSGEYNKVYASGKGGVMYVGDGAQLELVGTHTFGTVNKQNVPDNKDTGMYNDVYLEKDSTLVFATTDAEDVITVGSGLNAADGSATVVKTGEGTLVFAEESHNTSMKAALAVQGGSVAVKSDVCVSSLSVVETAEMTVSSGATIWVGSGDEYVFACKEGVSELTLNGLEITDSGLVSLSEDKASIDGIDMYFNWTDNVISISNVAFTNSLIYVDLTASLSDISLDANSSISAWVDDAMLGGDNYLELSSLTSDQLAGVTLEDGATLTLTLSQDLLSGVEGENFDVILEGLSLAEDAAVTINVQMAEGLTNVVTISGSEFNDGGLSVQMTTAPVPEPATATLSLLALAALAARRRRKAA